MVHKQATEPGRSSTGKLSVIGIFFDLTKGEANDGVQKISQVNLGDEADENGESIRTF